MSSESLIVFEDSDIREILNSSADKSTLMDKILSTIHKYVLDGNSLQDTAWDLVIRTGIDSKYDISTRKVVNAYIEKYGDPDEAKVPKLTDKQIDRLYKRSGMTRRA